MNQLRELAKDLKAELSLDHPLVVLMAEHDQMLRFLEKLEQLNEDFQRSDDTSVHPEKISALREVAQNLVSGENHHKREEDALFPRLERIGISGPPMVMRMEHDELRKHKQELLELANQAETMDTAGFKEKLDYLSQAIVSTLRAHIDKENNILYPAALKNIPDAADWDEIKREGDKVGYCPFTPRDGW